MRRTLWIFLPFLLGTATAADLTLAWERTDTVTVSYRVYQEVGTEFLVVGATNGLTWTVPGLVEGRTYRFYATGLLADQTESLPSNLVRVTVSTNLPPVCVPEVPANPWAQALSSSRIDVHWDALAGVSTFHVDRSRDGSTGWERVGTLPGTATTFHDTGLRRRTVYWYRVRACNANGCGGWTPTRWAKTFR